MRSQSSLNYTCACLLAGVATIVAIPAWAQEASSATAAHSGEVEQIVVTARKREERVQDVPDSISVFTAAALEATRVDNVKDVALRVPNLSIVEAQQPGVALLTIRGVGQARNGEPPIAVVVDGVQLSNAYQITQDLFDIERIEVLKGPQGAVYGRNAIGGAINITTKQPTNDFEGFVQGSYGTGQDWRLSAAISGPIVPDKLLFRLAGSLRDFDGDIESVNAPRSKEANWAKDKNIRGSLLFTPSDVVSVDLRYSRLETEAGAAWYASVPPGGDINEPRPFIGDYPSWAERILNDASAKVDVDLGAAMLTSVTAYSKVSSFIDEELDLSPLDGIIAQQALKTRNFSQELRLASTGNTRFKWLAGLYYLKTRQKLDTEIFLGADFLPLFGLPPELAPLLFAQSRSTDRNKAYAAFGQVSYRFDSGIELTGALRYDVDDRHQTDRAAPGLPEYDRTFKSLQPKVSATWFWNDTSMVYATVAKGFRSGGFNPLDIITRSYNKEENWNYEVGLKASAFDRKLTLTSAVFYTRIKDRQVYTLDVNNSAQTLTNPIPKSEVYGFEAEIIARPAPGFDLSASIGYTDSKIISYDTSVFAGLPAAGDYTGNKLPQMAKLSYALGAQYEHELGDDMSITPRVELNGSSGAYYWEVDNTDKRSGVSLVNARLTLRKGGLSLAGFVENLFDEDYIIEFVPVEWSGAGAGDLSAAAPGRRWGVQAKLRF